MGEIIQGHAFLLFGRAEYGDKLFLGRGIRGKGLTALQSVLGAWRGADSAWWPSTAATGHVP